jgi:CheY-like chemotaxis protein
MALRASLTSSLNGKILLVDGNASGLAARKVVLEEAGHKTRCASCAADALELLESQKFDLIVTDHKLPKMEGQEFVRRVRKLEVMVPIVMMSGFVDALGLNEANTGADAVIQKSAHEVNHLTRTVARLLRRRKPPASSAPKVKRQAV